MCTYKCHINIFMHFASVFCFIYETVIPNKSLRRVNIRNKNRNRDRVKERDHLYCKQTLSSSLCYCFHSLYTWFGRNKLNSFRTFWNSHLRHSRTLPTVRPLFKAIYCLSNVPKLRMERQLKIVCISLVTQYFLYFFLSTLRCTEHTLLSLHCGFAIPMRPSCCVHTWHVVLDCCVWHRNALGGSSQQF